MKPTQEQVIAWAEEAGFYPGELRAGFNLFMGLAAIAYEAGRKDEPVLPVSQPCQRGTVDAQR